MTTSISESLKCINKQFGQGTIFRLGDADQFQDIPRISTGLPSLDWVLCGGLPKGKIIELYGPESGGKSTLTLTMIAAAQQQGIECLLIDSEYSLDRDWAELLGVDSERLLISQPNTAEQAMQVADIMIDSVGLIVLDSVAAMIPAAEVDGEIGDTHMGVIARLMGQTMRKVTSRLAETGTIFICVNQLRMNLGQKYGNPETTPGGRALKFFASIRLDIRFAAKIEKPEGNRIGQRCRITAFKNKTGPPLRKAEIDLMFGSGFSADHDLIQLAKSMGVITLKGAWYSFGEQKLGHGIAKAVEAIQNDSKLREEIYASTRQNQGAKSVA